MFQSVNGIRARVQVQSRSYTSLKELKTRIRSVESVRKITSSMKTVATSRLKAAENRLAAAEPFSRALVGAMGKVNVEEEKSGKQLLIPMTADKGLCGSFNSSILRKVNELAPKLDLVGMIPMGEKAKAGLRRRFEKQFIISAAQFPDKGLTFGDVSPVAEKVFSHEEDFDTVHILHNAFVNILAFDTTSKLLPRVLSADSGVDFSEYEVEGDEDAIMNDMYQFYLAGLLYYNVVQGQAAELGQRMSSMDNATRNAGDMIESLNLIYNRRRQAGITTEICEIISGAAAVMIEED